MLPKEQNDLLTRTGPGTPMGELSLRRLLLNEIKNLQDGQEPTHVVTDPAKNHFPHVDTIAEVIPAGEDWRQRFKHLTAVVL